MSDIKKEVGNRLAEIRKSKKIKQDELREMIGAPTVQMISGWENGHSFPSTTYLIILAKKLDISLDYLLLGRQNGQQSKKIVTYKDAVEVITELKSSGLFEINGYDRGQNFYVTELNSLDKTIGNFKREYDKLLAASESLRPELFRQAIIDLLNKYDFPINQKQHK